MCRSVSCSLRPLVVLVFALMHAVCACGFEDGTAGDLGEDTGGSESTASLAPASLRWVLEWELGEAVPLESGWTSVNDLGYAITVEAGWFGSWGATLVPCTEAEAGAEPALGADARVAGSGLSLASPWLVAEGHTTGVDDPSAEVFDLVESLTALGVTQREPHELDGTRYCTAHYLLAPISEFSEGIELATASLDELDPELELAGASVLILASWAHPSGAAGSFALRSDQAYGKILEIEFEGGGLEGEGLDGASVELLVRRHLDTLFDGVDFELDAPDDAGWTVLGNLARGTSVEARPSQ